MYLFIHIYKLQIDLNRNGTSGYMSLKLFKSTLHAKYPMALQRGMVLLSVEWVAVSLAPHSCQT